MGCSGDTFPLSFFMVKSATVLCDMSLDVFVLRHSGTLSKRRYVSVDELDNQAADSRLLS